MARREKKKKVRNKIQRGLVDGLTIEQRNRKMLCDLAGIPFKKNPPSVYSTLTEENMHKGLIASLKKIRDKSQPMNYTFKNSI